MDRLLSFLQVNVIAFLLWGVAFFAWKDYLTHPHRRVTVEGLAHTTGPVAHLDGMMSLPSGSRTGYWLMLEGPRRDFDVPLGLDYGKITSEVREGTQVTVGYGPEVDPAAATATAFSLKRGDTEYLSPDVLVRSYNEALDRKLRLAAGCTLGGFVALGLVWLVRNRLLRRRA